MFNCNYGGCQFKTRRKSSFHSHIFAHIDSGASITCPYNAECKTSVEFQFVNSLKSHIFRQHKTCKTTVLDKFEKSNVNDPKPSNSLQSSSPVLESSHVVQNEIDTGEEFVHQSLFQFAKLYAILKSKHFVTERTLNVLIDSLSELNILNTEYLLTKFDASQRDEIRVVLNQNLFHQAHNKTIGPLRSTHCRTNFYKENFDYISPQMIELKNEKIETSKCYYIPILQTLKLLLTDSNVLAQCLKTTDLYDGKTFSNLNSGERSHELHLIFGDQKILKIVLYQDGVEICNPIGTSRLKHKVVAVYMYLANVNSWYYTKPDNIHLVALAFNRDVKKFGFGRILAPFLRDIKILETKGLDIKGCIFKGTLFSCIGDSLGNHEIGGLIESFKTTNYFCRVCYMNEFNKDPFKICKLRTVSNYSDDVERAQILKQSGKIHSHGVKHNSALNDLQYFHVGNAGLAPCLAHDLFEGVVQADVHLVLKELVRIKLIPSYLDLNTKLKTFSFESHGKINMPILKNSGDKLKGNATEIMWILLMLPFLMMQYMACKPKKVVVDNRLLEMIFLLQKICSIAMGFKISIGQAAVLKSMIDDYLKLRRNMFPNVSLIAKHHFLQHYFLWIKKYGSLRYSWTLRCESKHRFSKNVVRHTLNFKNALMSISRLSQLSSAVTDSYTDQKIDSVISKNYEILDALKHASELLAMKISKVNVDDFRYITKEVNFRGILYKEKMAVCYLVDEDGFYNLCIIKNMILNLKLDEVIFIGSTCKIRYNEITGLYQKHSHSDQLSIVPYASILSPETVLQWKWQMKNYYIFKSVPYETL